MFQFTREFIINDNGTGVAGSKGLLKDGKRFEVAADGKTLMVAGMVNLHKDDIVSASKVAGVAAVNEVVELKADAFDAALDHDAIYRMIVTISQQGRVTALVNDWHPMHKKQYFYEAFAAKGATALPLEDLAAVAAKEAVMEAPDRLIDVTASGNTLTVKALDPYTRVDEVRIVSVPAEVSAIAVGSILTGYMDYDTVLLWKKEDAQSAEGATVTFTAGSEGAGTVAQILKNKRLLTAANLDPYGQDLDERPVPGALYDQYLVETVSERRHIGSQVFGAIDHSLTSHVFFVRANATCEAEDASSAFAAELGKIAEIVTVEPEAEAPAVADAETLPKDVIKKNVSKKEAESGSGVSE